jgi:outer membrane lipase/esterase
MKRSSIRTLKVSLAAMAALLLTHGAQAQTYGRLVSFGDSLSDNGNLFANTGQPPAPYNKRFTNQLIFAEYLSGPMLGFNTAPGLLNSGSVNLAWGGARTDAAANSNGPILGTVTQVNAYLLSGGTFGARDVVSMWAGANNLFQGFPAASVNANPTGFMSGVAGAAASDIGSQLNQLSKAGAKTLLVFNLPNLGSAPQFKGSAAEGLAGFSGSTFNSLLSTQVQAQAAANSASNFLQVDIASAFGAIVANPTQFGFTNVTQQCILVTACVTGGAAVQDTYLFWDGVHPTGAAHRLVARLSQQYLYTETLAAGVSMFADQSYATRHSAMLDMADIAAKATLSAGENRYFLEVIGNQGQRNLDVTSQATLGGASVSSRQKNYDYNLSGGRIGMTQGLSANTAWAFAFSALTGDAKAYLVAAKPVSLSFDTGLSLHSDTHSLTATFGVSADTYSDYERLTLVSGFSQRKKTIRASSVSGSLAYGMNSYDMGAFSISPVGRLSYVNAKMEGFTESGVVAFADFKARSVNALSASLELHSEAKLSDKLTLTGLVGYEDVLAGKAQDLKLQLVNNTAKPIIIQQGDVVGQGVIIGLGLKGQLAGGYSIAVKYRGSFGDQDQQNQSAIISLAKAF